MIYDMTKPEHLAHFLNELPTKEIMQEHGRFYAKHKTSEFMAEVKRHMLAKTKIVPEVTAPGPLIARARNSDPDTSHDRADYINEHGLMKESFALVMRAMLSLETDGATSDEVSLWAIDNVGAAPGKLSSLSSTCSQMLKCGLLERRLGENGKHRRRNKCLINWIHTERDVPQLKLLLEDVVISN